MPDPVWGLLPKAQDDAQTINEAVDAAITAHNNDPDAHLGDGQSLQSHRASDIIDHLARSVYRDKFAWDRFQMDLYFESLDGYGKSSGVSLESCGDVLLTTTAITNNAQNLYAVAPTAIDDFGLMSDNPHFVMNVRGVTNSSQTVYFGMIDPTVPHGFGFKFNGSTLYAVQYDNSDDSEVLHTITGFDITDVHRYECVVTDGDTIEWFVDGESQYSAASLVGGGAQGNVFLIRIQTTTTAAKSVHIYSVNYDQEIN